MTLATRLNGVLAVVGTIPSFGGFPDLLCGELRTDDDRPWHLPRTRSSSFGVTACIRVAPNTGHGLGHILAALGELAGRRKA